MQKLIKEMHFKCYSTIYSWKSFKYVRSLHKSFSFEFFNLFFFACPDTAKAIIFHGSCIMLQIFSDFSWLFFCPFLCTNALKIKKIEMNMHDKRKEKFVRHISYLFFLPKNIFFELPWPWKCNFPSIFSIALNI